MLLCRYQALFSVTKSDFFLAVENVSSTVSKTGKLTPI